MKSTPAKPWDGTERRSPERLAFEESKKSGLKTEADFHTKLIKDLKDRTIEGHIYQRVVKILEGQTDDTIFSKSAAPSLQRNHGRIVVHKGALAVHKNPNDKFGEALVHRDRDDKFHTSKVPEGGTIVLSRTPIVTIPETPEDPEVVQDKARTGELRFEFTPTKTMAVALFKNGEWGDMAYVPAGSIEMGPTADRYGQDIFGGMRALRLPTGEMALFRPRDHAKRFSKNAERLLFPEIEADLLVQVFMQLARANSEYLPPSGLGSLYIAPGLRASGNQIGVHPNKQYIFTCMAIPAGKIFDKPAKLHVEKRFHRAAKGGVGDIKAAGLYAPTYAPKKEAKDADFDDIIYCDNGNTETRELSSSNIFFVTGDGVLVTPDLSGEILPGITRDSILVIAQELREKGIIKGIEERPVLLGEYGEFVEAFSCGTGVTINAIASVTDDAEVYDFDTFTEGMGPITNRIQAKFTAIFAGECRGDPRYAGWLTIVD